MSTKINLPQSTQPDKTIANGNNSTNRRAPAQVAACILKRGDATHLTTPHQLRQWLWDNGLYPYTGKEADDPAFDFFVEVNREVIKQAIEKLSRLDTLALASIACLLLREEISPNFYERYRVMFEMQAAACKGGAQ